MGTSTARLASLHLGPSVRCHAAGKSAIVIRGVRSSSTQYERWHTVSMRQHKNQRKLNNGRTVRSAVAATHGAQIVGLCAIFVACKCHP